MSIDPIHRNSTVCAHPFQDRMKATVLMVPRLVAAACCASKRWKRPFESVRTLKSAVCSETVLMVPRLVAAACCASKRWKRPFESGRTLKSAVCSASNSVTLFPTLTMNLPLRLRQAVSWTLPRPTPTLASERHRASEGNACSSAISGLTVDGGTLKDSALLTLHHLEEDLLGHFRLGSLGQRRTCTHPVNTSKANHSPESRNRTNTLSNAVLNIETNKERVSFHLQLIHHLRPLCGRGSLQFRAAPAHMANVPFWPRDASVPSLDECLSLLTKTATRRS